MSTDQNVTTVDARDEAIDQNLLPDRGFLSRLYTGTGAIDVIGRRNRYFMIAAVIVGISLLSIVLRGFTFGIDFAGGSRIQLPAGDGITSQQVEDVYEQTLGSEPVAVQSIGAGDSKTLQIRSEELTAEDSNKLQNALFEKFQPRNADGQVSIDAISMADVSSTWGAQITQKALIALAVFLALVAVYISIRFERSMALAAMAALAFDLIVTAGVYALVGFEVTPATVIGMLTILGFSLYDTVVVFDKVDENTRGILHLNKRTYGEQTNLAVNQTLMRSINTTIIGVLPVVGLMVIAVWLLGVGTLKDLALVQLVGQIVGAYSSVFFAAPLLVSIKERWGPVGPHTRKVLAKRAGKTAVGAAPASASVGLRKTTAPSTPRPGARPSGKRNKRRT